MDSKDDCYFKEDLLVPKIEPIDSDFIKEEEFEEEECSVEPGITVSLKVNKVSLKEENEETAGCSSSNVWN